jgi:hypothetical protein
MGVVRSIGRPVKAESITQLTGFKIDQTRALYLFSLSISVVWDHQYSEVPLLIVATRLCGLNCGIKINNQLVDSER